MTSPFTDDATRKFFESHKYFGLEADQVKIFQQGTLPCVSTDGRFIMETPYKVAKAPDGNGGLYSALKSTKLLEDMSSRGVKYVDCYVVDNALVRVADPTFLGYFIDKGAAAAAKVVRKDFHTTRTVCPFTQVLVDAVKREFQSLVLTARSTSSLQTSRIY